LEQALEAKKKHFFSRGTKSRQYACALGYFVVAFYAFYIMAKNLIFLFPYGEYLVIAVWIFLSIVVFRSLASDFYEGTKKLSAPLIILGYSIGASISVAKQFEWNLIATMCLGVGFTLLCILAGLLVSKKKRK
jgi:hypothetical protein